MLGKVVSESHRNWDTKVSAVMAAYRATSTKKPDTLRTSSCLAENYERLSTWH